MHPVCRRASDNLNTRVEETALLYKEAPKFPRSPWCEEQADSSQLFRLGLGETTWNLSAADEVSS
jgi:hypothetical protein